MNKLLTCGLLVALVAVTSAYDFQDSLYNELLASDWEDLEDDILPLHPRSRRDEEAAVMMTDKCHKRRPKFCCADETLSASYEEDKPIKKECFKQVTGKDKPSGGSHFHHDPFKCDKEKIEKHRKEMTCVMQCVGQKKDVLDADGNLKEDILKKQMRAKLAKEEWLTPKLDEMVDKCITEAKNFKDDKEQEEGACNGVGMRYAHCFWKELQSSCPADQIKDQKACDKVKERIKNHSEFPYHHHYRSSIDDE